MEEKRGGGMSAEEREKFCRIAKAWHGGGVEKPEIYHQKLVDNFKRAAAYVGFNESTTSLPPSNYPQDAMLMLYGLYKQATEATELDDIPLPKSSDELEQNLYWSRIGMHSMPPTLAMMNFVATVKTVDSEYCARASSFSRESFEQYELNAFFFLHILYAIGAISDKRLFFSMIWRATAREGTKDTRVGEKAGRQRKGAARYQTRQ
ncbi:unnamed protein product [Coffea canephora]|uniref:Uncharacterized protein n=1 Tax=Coffea canephora TaxID=49390 RepID=A0A068UAJ0_COFCA|nr:unnamed protein product [Coffea canephora]